MEQRVENINLVKVINRNNGTTGYPLPNGGLRLFAPGQVRNINIEELRELKDMDGGEYILNNYLIIDDEEALKRLDIVTEPEYFYTEIEIKKLLSNECSLGQLEDAFNFGPQGVADLIVDLAVKTKLNDMDKRELILKKTGFNVTNALMVNKILTEDTPATKEEEKPTRNAEAVTTKRKGAPLTDGSSKYKIID